MLPRWPGWRGAVPIGSRRPDDASPGAWRDRAIHGTRVLRAWPGPSWDDPTCRGPGPAGAGALLPIAAGQAVDSAANRTRPVPLGGEVRRLTGSRGDGRLIGRGIQDQGVAPAHLPSGTPGGVHQVARKRGADLPSGQGRAGVIDDGELTLEATVPALGDGVGH